MVTVKATGEQLLRLRIWSQLIEPWFWLLQLIEPYRAHRTAHTSQDYDPVTLAQDCAARVVFDSLSVIAILVLLTAGAISNEFSALAFVLSATVFLLHGAIRAVLVHSLLVEYDSFEGRAPVLQFVQLFRKSGWARNAAARAAAVRFPQNVIIADDFNGLLVFGPKLQGGNIAIDISIPLNPAKPIHPFTDVSEIEKMLTSKWSNAFFGRQKWDDIAIARSDVSALKVSKRGAISFDVNCELGEGEALFCRATSILDEGLSSQIGQLTFITRSRLFGPCLSIDWEIRWAPPLCELTALKIEWRDPLQLLRPYGYTVIIVLFYLLALSSPLILLAISAPIFLIFLGVPVFKYFVALWWRSWRVNQVLTRHGRYEIGMRPPLEFSWWDRSDRLSDMVRSCVSRYSRVAICLFANGLREVMQSHNINHAPVDAIMISNTTYDLRFNKGAIVGRIGRMRGAIAGRKR